ncbi:MAG: PQQ-binding-like beta-propeller repeat protein [Aureliella sp.]
MKLSLLNSFFAIGLALSNASAADPKKPWSAFQNSGSPVVSQDLPVEWTPESVAWKASIKGYGQSTALVSGEHVYVTSTSGDNKEKYHVTALDLKSGDPLWKLDFTNPTPEKNTTYVSRAAPTPVLDDNACYVFFEGGLVAAVSHAGEELWSRDLVAQYGAISARHGLASSLEHNDDRIFVWVERSDAPYLLALDKKTGSTVWKTAGLGSTTWSSPRLMDFGDEAHLVCSASGKIAGFDPAKGTKLWEFDAIANNTSCSPMPVGDGKFLIGASDGRGEENAGKGSVYNGVIEVTKAEDGQWQVEYQWHAKRATSSFGSPVVYDGKAYFVNRQGVLYKNDLQTGEESKPQRLGCGGIWATPLVSNNRLYLFGQKGATSVVDLESGEEIAVNQLWESDAADAGNDQQRGPGSMGGGVLYAASPAGEMLILRRGDTVYAIR